MNKFLPVILLIFIAALSGCTSSPSETSTEPLKFDLENPNLVGKIVEMKLDKDYIIAGDEVTAELIVANIGTETITNEKVEIRAKVKTLEDFIANTYLKFLKEEKKTMSFPINFSEEIEPGTIKTLGAEFHPPKEMGGRSLAGTYQLTVILSVNGQNVDGKVLDITLHSSMPKNLTSSPVPSPAVSIAGPTPTPTPTIIITPKPTPKPTPTPEPVVIATPTGVKEYTRIMGSRFAEPDKQIYAGDAIWWDNIDDEDYTIVEMDDKMANITVKSGKRISQIFNMTGTYRFGLFYRFMRDEPSTQTITVKVNASQ